MRDQNYLSLDLEINADGNGWVGDIIQVGILENVHTKNPAK